MAQLGLVQLPLQIAGERKGDLRTQFAALCWRLRRGRVEVLLVTSRRTKRWIAPKGWPMKGLTPAAVAAREAWEEAGAVGAPLDLCLGLYTYVKTPEPGEMGPGTPCAVAVFPVEVRRLERTFPEAGQRRRKWMSRRKAAARVAEPELARIIAAFNPAELRR